MKRILIVEDDEAMANALRIGFEHEGYSVSQARDGAEGLRMASEEQYEIIILDVMMPKMSGLDVCQQLRKSNNTTPIILLTARGQEIDKVVGLKIGADDYVTKPFSFLELLARAEAVQRRGKTQQPADLDFYEFGDVAIDFKRHEAKKNGKSIELTVREFHLLKYFIQHKGEIVTRDQLLDAVWGYNSFPVTRTVDTHLGKLRQKIEDTPNEPHFIITVHRLGYKFTG
jgi:two-component system alkaline phosphatase synthesis response regulator PhoP